MAEKEIVPRGYPSPQTDVHLGRDVGHPAERPQPAQPDKNAAATDAEFSEITAARVAIGIGSRIWGAVKWLGREVVMPALEKLIPQGAAELAQGLYTGNAYVPYGPTEKPVEDGGGVHGKAVTPANDNRRAANDNYPQTAAYEERVAAHAARAQYAQKKERGMERD